VNETVTRLVIAQAGIAGDLRNPFVPSFDLYVPPDILCPDFKRVPVLRDFLSGQHVL
jgi:hypothetical protein